MEPLTPFLTENRERILKFYEVISVNNNLFSV